MTNPQQRFISQVASRRWESFWDFIDAFGTGAAAASNVRNVLCADGYIVPWTDWNDGPRLTPAGRAAIAQKEGE
jgi:hypothetical protein